MSDFSEVEISALEQTFPGVTVYAIFIGSKLGQTGFAITRMVSMLMSKTNCYHCCGIVHGLVLVEN